jgi:hypothetical protein
MDTDDLSISFASVWLWGNYLVVFSWGLLLWILSGHGRELLGVAWGDFTLTRYRSVLGVSMGSHLLDMCSKDGVVPYVGL